MPVPPTGWKRIDDSEWSSITKKRVGRRFRRWIYTPSNPCGRILRPWRCCRCPFTGPIEAHHVDYDQPFLVAWLCRGCHDLVERGDLRLRPRDLWDYSSLVRPRPGRLGNKNYAGRRTTRRRPLSDSVVYDVAPAPRRRRAAGEVPF